MTAVRTLAGRGWLRTLAGGLALYALLTVATARTANVHLVPSVLVLGAVLVPVTFVTFVFERVDVTRESLPAVAASFAVGGGVGVASAALLEYDTLRDLGALPILAVGVIEESCKLLVPVFLVVSGRFPAPRYGVLFGVAAGMGFAALETMGYGLVALIQSRGQIGVVEEVLFLRGVLSPVCHAAWTGIVTAALWRFTGPHSRGRLAAAFGAAVLLHAAWDSTVTVAPHVAIGLVSAALLVTQLRAHRLGLGPVPAPSLA
jgi:RsiW-degrading membrane proteinase PrsW (M82 family)